MFRVGQRVVALRGWPKASPWAHPAKGGIYTVREVLGLAGVTAIRLAEITNAPTPWANLEGLHEAAWQSKYFRPLVNNSTKQSRQKIINNLMPSKTVEVV